MKVAYIDYTCLKEEFLIEFVFAQSLLLSSSLSYDFFFFVEG